MPRTATKTASQAKRTSRSSQKAESTEKKVPKKRGSKSAAITANLSSDTTENDISRIVSESYQYFNRQPPKSDDECCDRLNAYFKQCTETGQIPTVEDMALALGVTVATLWDWENKRSQSPIRSEMIKKAKGILQGIDAKLVAEGRIPQITYIFRAKNFYGMRDQQEVILTPNDPLGDAENTKQLQDKYVETTFGDKK